MAAIRRQADAIEKESPGTIHALDFTSSRRSIRGVIIYNRNRIGCDVDETSAAVAEDHDSATAPSEPRPKPRTD